MLRAMTGASVGDDVLGEDPTVRELEARMASLFSMDAALFCPSGTMTNQIAINVHTRPGETLICHPLAHIYLYEGGGIMANSGVSVRLTGTPDGLMSPRQVAEAIDTSQDVHNAPTRLVSVENTCNRGGGSCYPWDVLEAIGQQAREHKLAYHLDGARLFNALAATGQQASQYGQVFDSISICLSKSLGCPVGSLLLGEEAFIGEARRVRKRLGGGWRQAGYLAAAGIYALDHHLERLPEDHRKAQRLATALQSLPWVEDVTWASTNIVLVHVEDLATADRAIDLLTKEGLLIGKMDRKTLRMVTHLDVSPEDIEKACTIIEKVDLGP